MTRKPGPNDAYEWAYAAERFRELGHSETGHREARIWIAERRRQDYPHLRTFAPGDTIPYDVTEATDLDGDLWVRLGDAVNERDMWRMPGFDPERHEPGCQGCQLTPFLLDTYGPLTEVAR